MVRRHFNSGRTAHEGRATAPAPSSEPDDASDILPLRYLCAHETERREIVLDRDAVRMRRTLEARMTMTMTVAVDAYLGVSSRKDWDGETIVLVHEDGALSLPLPPLHGVAPREQAPAWAAALNLPCLSPSPRPAPRRKGNPLIARRPTRPHSRRHASTTGL